MRRPSLPESGRPGPRCLAATLTLVVAAACGERGGVAPPPADRPALLSMSGCGASYTMIAIEEDSLMAQHGLPTVNDTVQVCQSWTGSDYAAELRVTGSSENDAPDVMEEVQAVVFQGGTATGFDQSGAQVSEPEYLEASTFSLMGADAAQQQASVDDPYYGIRSMGVCDSGDNCGGGSGGGGGGGSCGEQLICDPGLMMSIVRTAPTGASLSVAGADSVRFGRHGVRRRGVRALVDASTELPRGPNGFRRFRRLSGADTVVHGVHPVFGLLMEEHYTGPLGTTRAKHYWRMVPRGFVRERTEIESSDMAGERAVMSRAVIRLVNVTLP